MQIDWTARGMTVHESLQKRLEQQINKLERFLYGHCEARVVVTQEGDSAGAPRRAVEVIVRNRAGTFTARDESRDVTESASAVMQRIQAQVQRAHDKLIESRRRGEADPAAVDAADEA